MTETKFTSELQSARNPARADDIRHGNVELRHLHYFIAVAEELNFHRAADRLNITQPAVTKQMAVLEEQVGVSLFARERHRLVGLTSAGAEFLAEARRILDEVEEAIRRAQRVALGRSGRLRIGLTTDAATLHLTSILEAFHARLPKVLVELVELSGSKVLPALRANTIDLALACEPENTDGFVVEELWRESWSVILPQDHPLCRKRAIVPADLAGEALALVRSSAQTKVLARIRSLEKELDGPRTAFRVCDRRTAIMLARAGSAIALAPSSSTWVAALRAAVRPLFKDPGYAVIALQHDIDPPPGLIGRFLNVVREFCCAHFSKAQLGSAAADWAERAVLSAACRCVRIKARSVLMNRSSMGGTMRSTVSGLLLREPTASA
jgi:DNA-binding transcriptional LysR family regulator